MIFFLNFRRKKSAENIRAFDTKQSWIMQKFDRNIDFWEKRQIFFAENCQNCDHNIDPCFKMNKKLNFNIGQWSKERWTDPLVSRVTTWLHPMGTVRL
jgi:hypothetical protein